MKHTFPSVVSPLVVFWSLPSPTWPTLPLVSASISMLLAHSSPVAQQQAVVPSQQLELSVVLTCGAPYADALTSPVYNNNWFTLLYVLICRVGQYMPTLISEGWGCSWCFTHENLIMKVIKYLQAHTSDTHSLQFSSSNVQHWQLIWWRKKSSKQKMWKANWV